VSGSPDEVVTPDLARLGRRVRFLVLLYVAAVVCAAISSTLIWPELLASQPALAGMPFAPSRLGFAARLVALTALVIDAAPIIWAAYHALRLCQFMAEGRLFTAGVPRHLQRMGFALVLTALLQPIGGALLSLGIGYFATGTGRIAFAFSTDHVGVAVIGAVLIAIAAAAREAIRIADENARFI
jgi:Protein of unknown function (DUF2975)